MPCCREAVAKRAHRKGVEEHTINGTKVLVRPGTKDVDAAQEVMLARNSEVLRFVRVPCEQVARL